MGYEEIQRREGARPSGSLQAAETCELVQDLSFSCAVKVRPFLPPEGRAPSIYSGSAWGVVARARSARCWPNKLAR